MWRWKVTFIYGVVTIGIGVEARSYILSALQGEGIESSIFMMIWGSAFVVGALIYALRWRYTLLQTQLSSFQILLGIVWFGVALLWLYWGISDIMEFFKYPTFNAFEYGAGLSYITMAPAFLITFWRVDEIPSVIRHEYRWRKEFQKEWNSRDPGISEYYNKSYDIDPFSDVKSMSNLSLPYSSRVELYTYEREYPMNFEPFLVEGASVGAQVGFSRSGLNQTFIILRSGRGRQIIHGDYAIVKTILANCVLKKSQNPPMDTSGNPQAGIIMPWEHFAALKTLAEYIAGEGLIIPLEAAFDSPVPDWFTSQSGQVILFLADFLRSLAKVSSMMAVAPLVATIIKKISTAEELWRWFWKTFRIMNLILKIEQLTRESTEVRGAISTGMAQWGPNCVPAKIRKSVEIIATY
jgi:hypothetical protein